MKVTIFTILIAILLRLAGGNLLAQAEQPESATSTPGNSEVIQHLLSVLCSRMIGDIRHATDDRARQIDARSYYGTLFTVWLGTQERPGGKVITFDMSGYIRAFLRAAEKDRFATLIDYDDPLSWSRVPADLDRQDLIDMFGGMPYYTWVLQQTKDPAAYQEAVRRFREFIGTIRPGE